MDTASPDKLKPPTLEALRQQKNEIIGVAFLFLVFRLMMLFWFQPYYSEFSHYFYPFMELSDTRVLEQYSSAPQDQVIGGQGGAAAQRAAPPGTAPPLPARPKVLPALPFIDYWLEYPPVFVWIALGIYKLDAAIFGMHAGGAFVFSMSVSIFLAFIDLANLVLLYAIGKRIDTHGFGMRAAVAYAMLFFPIVVMAGYFDTFVAFTILLALWGMVSNKPGIAGAATGLGIMTKFIPVLLIPAAVRYIGRTFMPAGLGAVQTPTAVTPTAGTFTPAGSTTSSPAISTPTRTPILWDWNRVINYFGTMVLTIGVVSSTFLVVRPDLFVMPFRVAAQRGGWETVRALATGQNDFGHVGPSEAYLAQHPDYFRSVKSSYAGVIEKGPGFPLDGMNMMPSSDADRARMASRFTTDLGYLKPPSDPYAIPVGIILAALFFVAWLFMPESPKPLHITALAGITFATAFAYSSGWSPQFIIYLIPFALLGLSKRTNVFLALALCAVTFVELPIWLRYVRIPNGPEGGAEALLWVVATMRVLLLAVIAVTMYLEVQWRAAADELLAGKLRV